LKAVTDNGTHIIASFTVSVATEKELKVEAIRRVFEELADR
jgi:hypothetical protein